MVRQERTAFLATKMAWQTPLGARPNRNPDVKHLSVARAGFG